jgi:hypothetical protein
MNFPSPLVSPIWPDAELLLHVPIPGEAVPAGSKRGMAARFKNKAGKWRVVTWFDKQGHEHAKVNVADVNATKLKKRAKVVEANVIETVASTGFMIPDGDVPLAVSAVFYRQRGKGHYRSGKFDHLLKPDAPAYPAKSPDTTKLWRALEDSLTGLLWQDDSRIVRQNITEEFVHRWEEPWVAVILWRLPETVADLPAEHQELLAVAGKEQATLLS